MADTVVASFAELVQREPEVVAHHWACAGEPAKAVPFWHAAGTGALERAAYLEAAEHFRRGLEALDQTGPHPDDGPAAVDLPTHLAAALQAGRGYAAAGVDTSQADRAVDALVGVLRTIELDRPSASVERWRRPTREVGSVRTSRGAASTWTW